VASRAEATGFQSGAAKQVAVNRLMRRAASLKGIRRTTKG
jgi:hypothetical protein